MLHLNESFFRNIIFFVASGVTAIGSFFFGNFFQIKQDVAILKDKTQIMEIQTAKDMQRIETGLDKLNDKLDSFFEKYQGPVYREPPR